MLDPSYIDAFDAEDQIFPIYPDFRIKRTEYESILATIQRLVGGQLSKEKQLVSIGYDELLRLVDEFPYDDKNASSSWIPGVLRSVLEKQRERCNDRAYLFTRTMSRKTNVFATGALSGDELKDLRSLDAPVFCAFRDNGKKVPGLIPDNEFWYPTLVLDRKMPSLIINTTPDGA